MADESKTINTDADLINKVGGIAGQDTAQTTTTLLEEQPTEIIDPSQAKLGDAPTVNTMTASMEGLNVPAPTASEGLGQVGQIQDVSTGLQQLGDAPVATFTPTGDYMTAPQGQVSPQSLANAATEELDKRGTVQFQLGQLMSSLEEGKPMPPWASPQIRKVNAIMQARNIGSSSMASAAITQSLMEAGVQIASADANKYSAIQLQNLNNKQQAALQNAATFAAMDTANLNARLQAAVTNARAFLSIDLKNLDNQQKSNTLTYQSLVAGLFKDAAEENARREFNAKNELQVEEFFAELGVQVETANANREASVRQFNVSEENSMAQYNATVEDSREKFNKNMNFAISQSNAVWRRSINTANTAAQNESNRLDTQLLFNANQAAISALWQSYRDTASWNFQKSENQLQREHAIGMAALEFAHTKDLFKMQNKEEYARELGAFVTNLILA